MTKILRTILIAASLLTIHMAVPVEANGQEALGRKESRKLAEEISSCYTLWNKVAIDGKLNCDMVPVPVTMKIFMERGVQTLISLRAPFVGEAVRVEVDKDRVLVVNKMKKLYTELYTEQYPELLDWMQSLLLGRIVLIGEGELSKKNSGEVEIYDVSESEKLREEGAPNWLIIPDAKKSPDWLSYGYSVNSDYRLTGVSLNMVKSTLNSMIGQGEMTEEETEEIIPIADADIEWKGAESTANLTATIGRTPIEVTMNFSSPEFGAKGFLPIELSSKYTRTDLRGVFSF